MNIFTRLIEKVSPFDWYTELDAAIIKEPTIREINILNELASSWVTCACGQLCKAIPRNYAGSPLDSELRSLGAIFSEHVEAKHWYRARTILDKIEARTSYLLTLSYEEQHGF